MNEAQSNVGSPATDPRFERWLQMQGVAVSSAVNERLLHDIFDAMDNEDK